MIGTSPARLFAQHDTTQLTPVPVQILQEITIDGQRLQKHTRSQHSDSVAIVPYYGTTLAQQLEGNTPIFVRAYGIGNLATTSLRGGSTAHTAVFWHGLNLQSPMNGTVDLALLPAFLTDSVRVQYAADGALWGSGAMGGSIHLQTSRPTSRGIRAGAWGMVGSFGQQQQGVRLNHASSRSHTALRAWRQQATNNFPYRNRARFGNPREEMEHAALTAHALTLEHQQQSRLGTFALALWWQQSERQIPPPLTVARSQAEQHDDALRAVLRWQHRVGAHTLHVKTSLLDEVLFFADPAISLADRSQARQWIQTLSHEVRTTKGWAWQQEASYHREQATTTNYRLDKPRRERLTWLGTLQWDSPRAPFALTASLRQEWNSVMGTVAPMPSLGGSWQVAPALQLNASAYRSFRLPTFNDLFWQPGGNPDLLPETGWGQELSANWRPTTHRWRGSVSAFNRNLRNQIAWQPSLQGYWSPLNLRNVWVRGLDVSLQQTWAWSGWRLTVRGLYQYLKATNRAPETPDNQLIYTPEQQVRGTFELVRKQYSLGYQHQLTDSRTLVPDASQSLPAYQVGNVQFSGKISLRSTVLTLAASCLNLWNTSYEVMAWRPMPGRSFNVSILLEFNSCK